MSDKSKKSSKKSFKKKKMKKGRGSSTRKKISAAVKIQRRFKMRRTKNLVEKQKKQKKACKTEYRKCMGYSSSTSSSYGSTNS